MTFESSAAISTEPPQRASLVCNFSKSLKDIFKSALSRREASTRLTTSTAHITARAGAMLGESDQKEGKRGPQSRDVRKSLARKVTWRNVPSPGSDVTFSQSFKLSRSDEHRLNKIQASIVKEGGAIPRMFCASEEEPGEVGVARVVLPTSDDFCKCPSFYGDERL